MKLRAVILISLWLGLVGAIFCLAYLFFRPVNPEFGVTFSSFYSENLGLDSRQTYLAILEDLSIKKIRLPIYWSEIEPQSGVFVWDDLDFFISEAEKRGAELMPVIGQKVPRWPECFIPDWADGLSGEQKAQAVLAMEKAVVERYAESSAIKYWQLENEPLFPFGICPAPDLELLNQETEQLRQLDDRPIVFTVSGELDPWFSLPRQVDYDFLGVSMYRVSYNQLTGLFPYPLTPFIYRLRSFFVSLIQNREVFVSELQAEPWFTKPFEELSVAERAAAFTPDDLNNNLSFVRQAGFSEVYLWGVEWWYAEKLAGQPDLWQAAKSLLNND